MGAAAGHGDVGIAGDQPHVFEVYTQPFHQELSEAGRVALAGGERAQYQVDASLGAHRDVSALAREARVELQVVRHADPATAAAPARVGPPGFESLPVGELDRPVERAPVVAAVV